MWIKGYIGPSPRNPNFYMRNLLKTWWEIEKMLVTSISFFSLNVSYHTRDELCHLAVFKLSANALRLGKTSFDVWLRVGVFT